MHAACAPVYIANAANLINDLKNLFKAPPRMVDSPLLDSIIACNLIVALLNNVTRLQSSVYWSGCHD